MDDREKQIRDARNKLLIEWAAIIVFVVIALFLPGSLSAFAIGGLIGWQLRGISRVSGS